MTYNPALKDRSKIDGFTEAELNLALLLYTEKLKMDIFEEIKQEWGMDLLDTEDESLLQVFHQLMDKAITKGMEFAADRSPMKTYFEQLTGQTVKIPLETYEFEEHKGVSGVLHPSGAFTKCGNGQHHLLTEEYPFEVKAKCLYFSSMLRFGNDGIVSNSPVGFKGLTLAQVIWCKDNQKYMDQGQKDMYFTKYVEKVNG